MDNENVHILEENMSELLDNLGDELSLIKIPK